MTGNGGNHNGGNGGDRSRFAIRVANLIDSNSFKEARAFTVAEFVSMGVSLGVVGVADQVAPNMLKSATKAIAKTVIEPYLDTIEGMMQRFCKLEECKIDTSKSREQRAEELAHVTVVFSAAWVISMAAKLATRRFLTNKIPAHDPDSPHYRPHKDDQKVLAVKPLFKGVSKHELKLFGADEGIHYGSLLLLNTGAAKVTDELIRASTNILVKCGMPEKKAHELSSMAMIWELPNFLGLLAGLGVVSKYNNHDWGQRRI